MKRYENARILTRKDIASPSEKDKERAILIRRAVAEFLRRQNNVRQTKEFMGEHGFYILGNLYDDPTFPDGSTILSTPIMGLSFEKDRIVALGTYEEYEINFGYQDIDDIPNLGYRLSEIKTQFPHGLDPSCEREHMRATKRENEDAYFLVFKEV